MKEFTKYIIAVLILAFAFAFSTFAAEGDFGFYDRDFDGELEITDALAVVKAVANGESGVNLVHAIRTLKMISGGVAVKLPIYINYDMQTVSALYTKGGQSYSLKMTFAQLGFDRLKSITPYESGYVTITVPSPAEDYLKSFDAKNVYAVKLESRYLREVLECIEGNKIARLNDSDYELPTAPVIRDGIFMMNASALRDFFKAYTTWNNETKVLTYTVLDNTLEMTLDSAVARLNGDEITAPAPLVYIGSRLYVPAEFVSEALGASVAWDEGSNTMAIARYAYPTFYIREQIPVVKAGEEVTITVYLRHNPGMAGFQYWINYDSRVMSYVSGTKKINNMFSDVSPNEGSNPIKFVAANLSLNNVSGDITTVEITFKVADDATSGMYELEFSNFEAYAYDGGEILPVKSLAENSYIIVE